jgi:hypothetical protein
MAIPLPQAVSDPAAAQLFNCQFATDTYARDIEIRIWHFVRTAIEAGIAAEQDCVNLQAASIAGTTGKQGETRKSTAHRLSEIFDVQDCIAL